MGILSNTTSICQFKVVGEKPENDLFDWAGEQLARNAFEPIENSTAELSVGWVCLDDSKETSFSTPNMFRRDQYIAFSLRRDQRRVPSALFRAHMEQAERDYLAANPGMQRVNKHKKEELRDLVQGKLLAKTLPAPAIYDAVWDTEKQTVSFTSLSPKIVELFENQFKETFKGLRLIAIHPYARAEALLDQTRRSELEKANQANTDTVLDLIKDNQWLGWDFFLWLMHQTMTESSVYRVSHPGPALEDEEFVAYLNDKLQLIGGGDSGIQKVTVAGPQDNFSEVCTALKNDKQITEAILYLEKGGNLWKMTLKGELFNFASFKAPAVKIEKDNRTDEQSEKEAVFYERMYVLEEGLQLFNSLYTTFLNARLCEEWSVKAKEIGDWLNTSE